MRASLQDEKSVESLVQSLSNFKLIPELINSLVSLNSQETAIKRATIEKLRGPAPLFVLTGQQVGLFGGPLLTFYKAVTAIKAARVLSEKLNRVVLPVFWLQSEDQDLLEISKFTYITPVDELKTLCVDSELAKVNRKSVGKVPLSSETKSFLDTLTLDLQGLPLSKEILDSLRSAYSGEKTWSSAFLSFFSDLFKDTELLFFDLNHTALKDTSVFKKVISRSIHEMSDIERILTRATDNRSSAEGVFVKQNSPLCFIEDDESSRFRLVLGVDEKFSTNQTKGLSFSKTELLNILETHPERFSTSALLRPIVQDFFFPTLAYIGGDAELKYHRQLDDLYPFLGLTPPLLLSRSKFRLLGRKTSKIVQDLGLDLDSYGLSDSQIGALLRSRGRPFGIDAETYVNEVTISIDELSSKFQVMADAVDPTLAEPLKKAAGNANNAFRQFISKLERASIQKDSVTLNRIERVRRLIAPFGKEQERELGLVSVLARTGLSFLEVILELSNRFDGVVQTLVIEDL